MKHEFKPGDPVMVEGVIKKADTNLVYAYFVEFKNQHGCWLHRDTDLHPIPTPPRPLRVDELEHAMEYEWDDCGGHRRKGIFRTNVGKWAIMEIPIGDDDYCVTSVTESANIRPVERVVSGEEIMKVFNAKMFDSSMADAIVETVRHFMKGGDDGH